MEWKDYLEKVASKAQDGLKKPTPAEDRELLVKLAGADDALAAAGTDFGSLGQDQQIALMQELNVTPEQYMGLQERYPNGYPEDVMAEVKGQPAKTEGQPAKTEGQPAATAAQPAQSEEDKALVAKIQSMSPEEWQMFAQSLSDDEASHVMDLLGIDKEKVASQLDIYQNSVIAGMGMFDGWTSAQQRMEKLASAQPEAPAVATPTWREKVASAVANATKKK